MTLSPLSDVDLLPSLSDRDLGSARDSSLDPLGLALVADRLADRLAPSIRERQRRLRFLTAMAVGNVLCHGLDDLEHPPSAAPPFLAYEWHFVQGMVLGDREEARVVGIPGGDKVRRALAAKLPVSTKTYLAKAYTFGFHGIYRPLAAGFDIARDGTLGAVGVQLLEAWESATSLTGFSQGRSGTGAEERERQRGALTRSYAQGALSPSRAWVGWMFFQQHLNIDAISGAEKVVLRRALFSETEPIRAELVSFLAKARVPADVEIPEKDLYAPILKSGTPGLRQLLRAIYAYEAFARRLTDTFHACLNETVRRPRLAPAELARLTGVQSAAKAVPDLHAEAVDALMALGLEVDFHDRFAAFGDPVPATDWVTLLLDHHERNQERKKPSPRAPWLVRDGAGRAIAARRFEEEPMRPGDFVHFYRGGPLTGFLRDLGQ